jgi:hypothetical protein
MLVAAAGVALSVSPLTSSPTHAIVALAPAADHADVTRVASLVRSRNLAGHAQHEHAVADGWVYTDTPSPDERLLALDPALLPGREAELRDQLASTTPAPALAGRVAFIVRSARDESTRMAAVEALGRMPGDGAQRELMDLLTVSPLATDDPARALVAPRLRPLDLDDPLATDLALLLDSPLLAQLERQQVATTLALIARRDGTRLPDETLELLSPAARALLASEGGSP